MAGFRIQKFSKTRIATIDVCAIGLKKHHVASMIEIDVTDSRKKIKKYKNETGKISFNAWLIKAISLTIKNHEQVAAYLKGKQKLVIFNDINVSMAVEKELNGQKVPVPLVIEKANERSLESITAQISEAKSENMAVGDMVLQRRSGRMERMYNLLPGFIRRTFWRYLLKHPFYAYRKMGNIAVTSIGMVGNVNGWFIPVSVHPVCFGINGIAKKPLEVDGAVEVREMLNLTVLLDHDVVDGAYMARFLNELSGNIRNGIGL
ncbi:MAG TPA: 2-oxo acid dehydrogenase subunit E2 [Bacteroidales bacterium]|nr:2-oxo acid dehydrogenase subunit E2 [Bacteroidales bacterium]